MTVRTRIIRIGNSQGIRIPKPLLEQSGITGDVEIEVEDNNLTFRIFDFPIGFVCLSLGSK